MGEGALRGLDSGSDNTAEVGALGGNDIKGGGSTEIDDNTRPSELPERGDRITDAVGADSVGVG